MVKVFVGNLAFKTTEADLGKEFAVAGNVVSANIITRGPRSLGYGFVEFNSEEEANKAVTLLNKKEIDGRPVNVEVAKPRAEGEGENKGEGENSEAGRGGFRRRGGFRGGRGRGGFRGGRGRGGFRGGFRNNGAADGSEEVEDTNRPRGGFRRGRGGRGGRGGRSPRADQPDNRVESKTTLFVANLPFSVDDEGLAAIFQGYNLKSAHVVRTHSGRSRGYGFVVFENEDDQLKALQGKQGATVEGTHNTAQGPQKQTRTIAISISSSVVSPDDSQQAPPNPTTQ